MNGNLMYEMARQRMAEQQRAAQQPEVLLLADVREAVSQQRSSQRIDLSAALQALAEGIASTRIELALDDAARDLGPRAAHALLADMGVPLLIHQPSYSMFNRHVENVAPGESESLLDVVGDLGIGTIVFSPLAQGLLTDRYLSGEVPADSRAATSRFLSASNISDTYLQRARALNDFAQGRGQSLAQLALSWLLRDPRVTSALIGASSVAQLENNVAALAAPPLTADELAAIEPFAVDGTVR